MQSSAKRFASYRAEGVWKGVRKPQIPPLSLRLHSGSGRDDKTFWVGMMPYIHDSGAYLTEDDLAVAEMLGDQAADERFEGLAGFGEYEGLGGIVPVELETGGESGNPNLPDGSVGCQNKFGRRFLEADVKHAVLFFHLKVGVSLGDDQCFFQRFQSAVGMAPKSDFVKHRASVPTFPPHRMHVE